MDGRRSLFQILREAQSKYRSFRDGEIRLAENETPVTVKCPKSFKYDTFVEIDCHTPPAP